MMVNKIIIRALILLLIGMVYSQNNPPLISNEPFFSGEDGVIRMYINIGGHVKKPGTYLVYDGIDLMTAISILIKYKFIFC